MASSASQRQLGRWISKERLPARRQSISVGVRISPSFDGQQGTKAPAVDYGDQHWCANQGQNNPVGQLERLDQPARQNVGQQQKQHAEQGGETDLHRQLHRLYQSATVGSQKADKTDGAGDGDGTGGKQGGGQQHANPHPVGADPSAWA